MKKIDQDISKLFLSTDELPEIVASKMQDAYRMIRTQETFNEMEQEMEQAEKFETNDNKISFTTKNIFRQGVPKVACLILAFLLLTGGTVAAATTLKTRWDRMKSMDADTVKQYYEELQTCGAVTYLSTREFTENEWERYKELEKEYNADQRFPQSEISRLADGETYSGTGLCLQITPVGEENILHMPDNELTDEELLEMIEYQAKLSYSIEESKWLQAVEKGGWEARLSAMTDEEVDYYYLAFCTGVTNTSGGYRRKAENSSMRPNELTGEETVRYRDLLEKYENENLYPSGEMIVIEYPEDYSGSSVALCRYDSNFYLPDSELTDEEILEIIDFKKKMYYVGERINQEIQLGYRSGYPRLPKEPVKNPPFKSFAETVGTGTLKEIADAQIGDTVIFGNYEQDNNSANGKEAIEWYVLDKSADSMTLLSVKILDSHVFAELMEYTTWKDSDVRRWLNSEFYNTAFTQPEQSQILSSKIENPDEATEDFVYLLSFDELVSYFGIDLEELDSIEAADYWSSENKCIYCYETLDPRIYTEATESAREGGLWYWSEQTTASYAEEGLDFSRANGKSTWWLRTPYYQRRGPQAYMISEHGNIDATMFINYAEGIRPVIQIKYP